MYSNHRTCISVPHFVGVFIFAGTINRSPTAANGLPLRCERIAITWRTFHEMPNQRSVKCPHSPTKCPRNTPPGVGADSSRPYPDIIKYTYPFHHTRILTSSNTHIHFIANVHSSPISWVFSYMRAR